MIEKKRFFLLFDRLSARLMPVASFQTVEAFIYPTSKGRGSGHKLAQLCGKKRHSVDPSYACRC